jgi:2-methylisocitrate lyase-like PEP mutase family enzyme
MTDDATERQARLRRAVETRRGLLVPGAANALTARIIEDLGFEAVYLTGAGLANTGFGMPDLGLVSVSELAEATASIAESCRLPLIVDADTGFGNPLNTVRTVRLLERAGASALQLEDQVFPKRCGHFSGKAVIPAADMVAKVKAAVDTRRSAGLLVIARTDALAVEGIDAALDRAARYVDAGADITFVEAPRTVEDLRRIAGALPVPQIVNLVVGGRTPLLPQAELAAMGFAIVLYANAALQAAVTAMQEVLGALKRDGSLDAVASRLADFAERQRVVGKDAWDALEARYRS